MTHTQKTATTPPPSSPGRARSLPTATMTAPAKGLFATRDGRLGLLSMLALVFQGTALSLVLRYSR